MRRKIDCAITLSAEIKKSEIKSRDKEKKKTEKASSEKLVRVECALFRPALGWPVFTCEQVKKTAGLFSPAALPGRVRVLVQSFTSALFSGEHTRVRLFLLENERKRRFIR